MPKGNTKWYDESVPRTPVLPTRRLSTRDARTWSLMKVYLAAMDLGVCAHCGLIRPYTDFHEDRARHAGIHSRCKTCIAMVRRYRMGDDMPNRIYKDEKDRIYGKAGANIRLADSAFQLTRAIGPSVQYCQSRALPNWLVQGQATERSSCDCCSAEDDG